MHQYLEKTEILNTISKNIIFLLNKYRISIADLSRKTGIIYMTLSRIVNGQTPDPKISNLIDIAEALNVTVDNLIYSNFLVPELNRPNLIPIISIKNIDNNLKYLTTKKVKSWLVSQSKNERKTPNGFVIAISGRDVASSLFTNECVLVIATNIEPENGDYVLVDINNTGPSVKKFHYDPPHNHLTSISTKSSLFKIQRNTIIIGVIIETIMKPICVNLVKE